MLIRQDNERMRGMNGTNTGYNTSGQHLWRKVAETRRTTKEKRQAKAKNPVNSSLLFL